MDVRALQWLVACAVGLLVILLYLTTTTETQMMAVLTPVLILVGLFSLFCLIPGIAVTVRRLHDTDRSGWNLLWGLLPLVGGFILLYFYVSEGDRGPQPLRSRPERGGHGQPHLRLRPAWASKKRRRLL